jgi:cytochrome oxidase Cu insertion factor (SCO1/SenC/PrrC family)
MHRSAACHLLILAIIAALLLLTGCTTAPESPAPQSEQTSSTPAGTPWKDTPLTDLGGRGNFTISSFAGKTVIVPLVSVSCATCIPQLNRQIEEAASIARADNGNRTEVIVLDLDPAAGPDFLTAYGGKKIFAGWSARIPQDMALQVFHRFGPFAVDTQAIPVILVCPDGHDLLLRPGLKTARDLDRAIAAEC